MRAGAVEDPADRPGQADVAGAELTYDDAGTLALRVGFHGPVDPEEFATIDWAVTGAADGAGCGDTREGVAALLEVRSGETTLTYSEVPEDGVPFEVEIPARQALSQDGRTLTVTAESASLTRRSFRCSQLALSNGDEVPPIVLTEVTAEPPKTGPPEVKLDDGVFPERAVGGLRVSRLRLSFDRRGRRVVASLRARVCAPVRTRLVAEVRQQRRRIGRRRWTPLRLHTYRSLQRMRCQRHRWSWRYRTDPSARYLVRAQLRLRAADAS
ncbi:MAG TPA: hypothetical protein VGR12_06380 [Solirubrobacteraceae bacterium]|nr:hypothetical protein [Solirubrobacteraceae bacterium]